MAITRGIRGWCTRRGEQGFTLIEIFVVLAVLGLMIALALPRYLSARKHAFVAEADNVLEEMRTVAWAYYLRYNTWAGLTNANVSAVFYFEAPDDADACWDFGLAADGTTTQIQLRATGDDTPIKCGPVNGGVVTLTLNGNGSASRSQNIP